MTYSISYAELASNLPLRGQGIYKWYFLKVYEAKLWADQGDDLYSKSLLLELKYKRDFKGEDIVKQSIKELVPIVNPASELKKWENSLFKIFPDVKEGDTIQASFDPKVGITFYLNSTKELGKLADIEFSKKYLDIWLGEKTNAPDLRTQLLGKKISMD